MQVPDTENLSNKIDKSVQGDKVELLYSSTGTAFAAILVATLALYYLFSPVLDGWVLNAWAVYMLAVGLARIVVCFYFNRAGNVSGSSSWHRLYVFMATATGIGWGMAAYFFIPDLDQYSQLILTLVMVAYVAGAMTTQFPSSLSFAGIFYPAMVPLIYRTLQQDNSTSFLIGFMILIFSIFIVLAAKRLRELMTSALHIRYQITESEALMRAVVENVPGGVFLLDEDLNYILTNRRYLEIFNIPDGMADKGKPIEAVIRHLAPNQVYGEGNIDDLIERRLAQTHEDTSAPVEVTIDDRMYLLAYGRMPGEAQIGIVLDITERKQAEEESRRSLERLKRQSNQIEFIQKLARIANEAKTLQQGMEATLSLVCDYTGWALGHAFLAEGSDLSVLYPEEHWVVKGPDQDRFTPFMERTARGPLRFGEGLFDTILEYGEPVVIADVSQDENFSRRKMAVACGLHGGFGLGIMVGDQVVGVLEFYSTREGLPPEEVQASLADIGIQLGRVAERTRMLQKHAQATHEAQQASRAKSEFLSSMSHELRTPMNAILGFGQMLELDTNEPLSEKQKSYVDHILRGGEHLMELIDQVLEMNKIESGKLTINFVDISAQKIIDECLRLVQMQAQEKNVDILDKSAEGELPSLWTDGTRLTQVLLNLLSNAVKYNRNDGRVTLSCEETSERMLRILVVDTGMGIPEDEQQNLFKPFERLGREGGEIEGTGIGLTITKELIELLGGKIGYQSKKGKGSTFWIDVPMSRNQIPAQKKTEVLGE